MITYDPKYRQYFADLNYQWIEHYFEVEDEDRAALDHPDAYALDKGGEIFFVLEDGVPVGTVAIVPFQTQPADVSKNTLSANEPKIYELAKMAVSPQRQGRGYSKLLMQACIEFAQANHATQIVLITNDKLTPALTLYQKAGFKAAPTNTDQRYARGNLEMHLTF